MTEVKFEKSAMVFDVDDSVVKRQLLITTGSGWLARNPFRRTRPIPSVDDLPDFDHSRLDSSSSGITRQFSLAAHMRRAAIPEMRDLMIESYKQGDKIHILSGRPTFADWYDMTVAQLDREGMLPCIEDPNRILLTPPRANSILSKIHGLWIISQRYEQVTMHDDNWPTISAGATALPHVQFRYVYHGFPGYYPTPKQLATLPNVAIIDLNATNRS